ncbi:MAG: hypothetical protein JWM90_118 [Thermoleophilia bacterium]|nr:hypothetical protein [Thermoleophilia bacterium]
MPRRRPVVLASLFLLLAALLLAGCGSDAPPQLSKRDYIERFNTLQSDASQVFADLAADASTPAAAASRLGAIDELITGVEELDPPQQWRDEHGTLLTSLRTMRESMGIISRAGASKTTIISTQVRRYTAAQRDFERAVKAINASR